MVDWEEATRLAAVWLQVEFDPHGAYKQEYFEEMSQDLISNIRMAEES